MCWKFCFEKFQVNASLISGGNGFHVLGPLKDITRVTALVLGNLGHIMCHVDELDDCKQTFLQKCQVSQFRL